MKPDERRASETITLKFLRASREVAFTPDLEQAYVRVYYTLEDLGLM